MIDIISIEILQEFGYSKEEAINILSSLNPDGSEYHQLPF